VGSRNPVSYVAYICEQILDGTGVSSYLFVPHAAVYDNFRILCGKCHEAQFLQNDCIKIPAVAITRDLLGCDMYSIVLLLFAAKSSRFLAKFEVILLI
jgi:hypothetical protein